MCFKHSCTALNIENGLKMLSIPLVIRDLILKIFAEKKFFEYIKLCVIHTQNFPPFSISIHIVIVTLPYKNIVQIFSLDSDCLIIRM